MPARLLAEWAAFYQLEPFGPPAEFTRAGIVASQVFNVQRTKDSQPVAKPADYLPKEMLEQLPFDDDTLGQRNAEALQMYREAMERRRGQ
jgi:hypothetical protein